MFSRRRADSRHVRFERRLLPPRPLASAEARQVGARPRHQHACQARGQARVVLACRADRSACARHHPQGMPSPRPEPVRHPLTTSPSLLLDRERSATPVSRRHCFRSSICSCRCCVSRRRVKVCSRRSTSRGSLALRLGADSLPAPRPRARRTGTSARPSSSRTAATEPTPLTTSSNQPSRAKS